MDILTNIIPNFFAVLLRAGIVVGFLPFFGSANVPARFKIGFAVAVALVLAPVVQVEFSKEHIPALVMREIVFGVVLGGTARLAFYAVDMGGQMISNATGLSIGTLFNPDIGQSTEVARLYGLIAMLIFLAMDGHHDLIALFVKSYEIAPSGQISVERLLVPAVTATAGFFVLAVKISAPMVVTMLVVQLLFGFIYKAAPQMNIFFVGYPVLIFIGLLVMIASMPVFVSVMGSQFSAIKDQIMRLMAAARG